MFNESHSGPEWGSGHDITLCDGCLSQANSYSKLKSFNYNGK